MNILRFIKSHKILTFYVLILITGILIHVFINNPFYEKHDSIKINSFESETILPDNNQTQPNNAKRSEFYVGLKKQLFNNLNENADFSLVVPNVACQAYSVYFNGMLIGSVGDMQAGKSNIEHSVNSFYIDRQTIKDYNLLKISALAENQINSFTPVSIVDATYMPQYAQESNYSFSTNSRIAFGIAIFGFIVCLMLYVVSAPKNSSFLFFSISLLLIAIHTFNYAHIESLPIGYFLFKRIMTACLYACIFFASLGMYKFFFCKADIVIGAIVFAGFLFIVFTVNNAALFKVVHYYNFIIFGVLISWIRTSLKYFKRCDEAKMFFLETALIIIFAAIEIYSTSSGNPPVKGSAFVFAYTFSTVVIILFYREFINKDMQIQIVNNAHKESYLASITDGMTGLYNHRYLAHILRQTVPPFSVAMIDIDDFKDINDNYGHRFGDEIINFLATSLTSNVRSTDYVFRYGGDEFFIIFPGCTAENAKEVLLKLKSIIDSSTPEYENNKIKITFSGGIYYVESMQAVEHIYDKVDNPLYASKKQGKNKVTIYKHNA